MKNTKGKDKNVNITKLNEALEEFGSLPKANAHLEKYNLALKSENKILKEENEMLTSTNKKLAAQNEEMDTKVKNYQARLHSLANQIKVHSCQYELFCGFMAMVTESPSVTDSLDVLINIFTILKEPGWHIPKNADEMRSLFIYIVMGDHLKCYRCDACGARFIVNKKAKDKYFGTGYYCPACHNWYAVKPDDSFLRAMVSKQQLEKTLHLEKILAEYEELLPFKAFLDVPCEICHEPVKEWDDYNVKIVIQGVGCGHTSCWNSQIGQWRQLANAIDKANKKMK